MKLNGGYLKCNMGCGDNKKAGYINIDISQEHKPDVLWDLNKFPYPFKENTVDEIFCQNTLEHLDDIVKIMEEWHRICKAGAIITISVPFYNNHNNFRDFTHKHSFTLDSFYAFTNEKTKGYHYSDKRFKVISKELRAVPWLRWFPKRLLNFAAITWGNIAEQITFRLEVLK